MFESDPTRPEFWEPRYAAGRTPWDQGSVPPALARFLARHPGRGATVLIPGCGSGHEIAAFADAGYRVTAIDFSVEAVQRARAHVATPPNVAILHGDFFTHALPEGGFDLVYERTFLCALPPERWPAIVQRTRALLRPEGVLAGIYFWGEKDDGPPFGFEPGEPEALFGESFALERDEPIPPGESLPLFAGRERWQQRRRRGAGHS